MQYCTQSPDAVARIIGEAEAPLCQRQVKQDFLVSTSMKVEIAL